MKDQILLGVSRRMVPIPGPVWRRHVADPANLAFMSEDHHRVRDFAVLELPRVGGPLPPDDIARALDLPPERVVAILDELERHMTFVYRDGQGAVLWAYPVTAEPTPHRVTFGTGEQIYAA